MHIPDQKTPGRAYCGLIIKTSGCLLQGQVTVWRMATHQCLAVSRAGRWCDAHIVGDCKGIGGVLDGHSQAPTRAPHAPEQVGLAGGRDRPTDSLLVRPAGPWQVNNVAAARSERNRGPFSHDMLGCVTGRPGADGGNAHPAEAINNDIICVNSTAPGKYGPISLVTGFCVMH